MELIKKVISKYPEIAPQALIVHGAGKYDLEGASPPDGVPSGEGCACGEISPARIPTATLFFFTKRIDHFF